MKHGANGGGAEGRVKHGAKSARGALRGGDWDACFPAAILVVDRPAIIDLFVASGALVQARIAVVCVDGTPAPVVSWLRRGLERGHRAPVGYLHDARTVLYPFFVEPLATVVALARGASIPYRDLGIGPGRPLRDPLGLVSPDRAARATRLDEVPAASLVAYACRELLRMVPPDPMLLPMAGRNAGEPMAGRKEQAG